ncbi:pre-rRNA-processing protein esf1 [Bulinus truncatus]|nr:pre-rRNA-processing protein esf1 [Bulinus truncatus]
MKDIEDDPRFSHIASDPRFRPMPKSKRKVKIDSRFQSLFTSSHFSHKTDIDKRGRPVFDWTKKSKHVMERFYELSDSDIESDDKNEDNDKQSSEKQVTNESQRLDKTDKQSPVKNIDKKTKSAGDEDLLRKKRKREQLQTKLPSNNKKAKQEKNSDEEDIEAEIEENSDEVEKENSKYPVGEDEDDSNDKDDDSEEDSDDDSDADLPEFTKDYALEETEVDHKWNELHNDAPAVTESTRRLAVCNMDWDFVKAQDLYILFKSFVPEGGHIKSVTIYPSEFGKERMAEEAMLGPREIREGIKIDDSDDDGRKKKKVKDQKKLKLSEKEKEAAQTEKLREYQLNRLRYYYAVVDCDSVRTADNVYSECDGREYQLSSVRLDLRFIPDDMTFEDEPREVFTEEQNVVGYQPSKFHSTALSQAKVEVTWDETEFDRLSRRVSLLTQKELESIVEDNKYADIIAPPESDSEEEEDGRPSWLKAVLSENSEEQDRELTEEEKIQLYRKVIMDKLAEDEEEKKEEEGEMDKEIEWQPGLKQKVEKKLSKKEKQEGNAIVGEFLEKKKEKKKKKREEKKIKKKEAVDGEENAFSDDELPDSAGLGSLKELMEEENISSKGKKTKKKKKQKKNSKDEAVDEVGEKSKAELELMLMGEGSSEKKLSKPELVSDKPESKKKKKKKAKLLKQKASEDKSVEDFKLDIDDPRFGALYTSHLFHIDPTAPQFKKTKNMMKLMDEQIKRKNKSKKSDSVDNSNGVKPSHAVKTGSKTLSETLIENLKRKMKK